MAVLYSDICHYCGEDVVSGDLIAAEAATLCHEQCYIRATRTQYGILEDEYIGEAEQS